MNDAGVPLAPAASSALPPAVPLTFGQILDRLFRMMRANLKPFLGIASVPAGIMTVFYGVMLAGFLLILQPWEHPNPAAMAMKMSGFMAVWFVVYLLFMLVFALYFPAGIYAALRADTGITVTVRDAYAKALQKAGRYIWLMILLGVIVVGPILVLAAVVGGGMFLAFAGSGHVGSGQLIMIPLIGVFYIGVAIYGILMGLYLSLAYPACVAEDLAAWTAIRRSFSLTHGAKGRIFLLMLVIYALIYAGMLVVELVLGIVGAMVFLVGLLLHLALNPWGFIGIGLGAILLLAAMFAMMACSWAGYTATFALVYRDQRLRMEGVAPVLVG